MLLFSYALMTIHLSHNLNLTLSWSSSKIGLLGFVIALNLSQAFREHRLHRAFRYLHRHCKNYRKVNKILPRDAYLNVWTVVKIVTVQNRSTRAYLALWVLYCHLTSSMKICAFILVMERWRKVLPCAGMSQRQLTEHFGGLTEAKDRLVELVEDFLLDHVCDQFDRSNYIFDCYITSQDKVRLWLPVCLNGITDFFDSDDCSVVMRCSIIGQLV